MWSKIKKYLDWFGYGQSIWQVWGWLGLPVFGGAWAVTFFGSAVEGLSVTAVWLASLTAGFLAAAIYAAIAIGIAYHRSAASHGLIAATPLGASRPIPITPDSIFSFLNGYPVVRETDQAIASDLGLQLEEDHFPDQALASGAKHFGVTSLSDLETLLRTHQKTVIGLSRYFKPKGSGGAPAKLVRGHSVHMLLEMMAARPGSIDAYMDYIKATGGTCGPTFGQDVINAYKQIAPLETTTKSKSSRPNIMYSFEATLPQLEGAPIAWTKTPHLRWLPRADGGRDVISIFVEGKNIGDKEIELESAYLVSDITGTRLEMTIEVVDGRNVHMVPVANAGPIPPQAEIKLLSAKLDGDDGIEETQFQKYWGTLSFVVEFGGKEHRKTYDREAIDRALEAERIDPPQPHVTLRKL